jgi:hypothetical protein
MRLRSPARTEQEQEGQCGHQCNSLNALNGIDFEHTYLLLLILKVKTLVNQNINESLGAVKPSSVLYERFLQRGSIRTLTQDDSTGRKTSCVGTSLLP